MRSRLTAFLLVAVALVFGGLVGRRLMIARDFPGRADTVREKVARVLTYSTFAGPTGPGKEIFASFEKRSGFRVEVVSVADANLMLERLRTAREPFDAVIGLDQLLLRRARAAFRWRRVEVDTANWLPVARGASDWESPGGAMFIPIDWSPLSFVYREAAPVGSVPRAFDDLLLPEYARQFALQDPHASSPGVQFVEWVTALRGSGTADWLGRFHPNVHSVSPNWSYAYSLFMSGGVRFVFSYLTSLVYHWREEGKRDFQVLTFPEGHPVQIEYAAVPDNCVACEAARELVRDLVSPEAQTVIMNRNYMFPVVKGLVEGTVFGELPKLVLLPPDTGDRPLGRGDLDLRVWDGVFGR